MPCTTALPPLTSKSRDPFSISAKALSTALWTLSFVSCEVLVPDCLEPAVDELDEADPDDDKELEDEEQEKRNKGITKPAIAKLRVVNLI